MVSDQPADRGAREGSDVVDGMDQVQADATVIPMPRPAAPKRLRDSYWQIVYQLQESEQERDGLSVFCEVAVSLKAAMQLADERAGRFASGAGEWRHAAGLYHPEYQPWVREVPNMGREPDTDLFAPIRLCSAFQHITPVHLHGAPR